MINFIKGLAFFLAYVILVISVVVSCSQLSYSISIIDALLLFLIAVIVTKFLCTDSHTGTEGQENPTCEDCGLPYQKFGIDTTLPNEQWLMIHPESKEGLLCTNCIVNRASHLPGIIVSRMVFEILSKSEQGSDRSE